MRVTPCDRRQRAGGVYMKHRAHLFPASHTERFDVFQRSVLLDVAIGCGGLL